MKKVNILIAALFITLSSVVVAGNNPSFLIEEENENYVVYLQFEEAASYIALSIEGKYEVDGVAKEKMVELAGDDLKEFNSNLVQIQSLAKEYDFVSYTVEVVDSQGDVWKYPKVHIQNEDKKLALAERK